MRIGIGYDVHPLVDGRPLILGGVTIAYERGLSGHSDADVLVHAVVDSLLGAASMQDIGFHFPDNDPRYKDISSIELLKRTGIKLSEGGFRIVNTDATIVCDKPKLADYIDEMVDNISGALNIDSSRVSVKASSSNGVGPLGKGEGIAAYAVALIDEESDK
jgi:2-C-methyl-D-erythritol 2,4-cyclodiphosphate synthase